MALNEQAMLVNLNISMWDARKYDKVATHDVETKHGANDAGRFNKLLIDRSALDPLVKATGAARQHHYKMTLAWGDNGDRLLPSKMYFKYTSDMRTFKHKIEAAADEFVLLYPALVQAARKRLGTLWDSRDYPSATDVRKRFGMEMSFMPVPAAEDFRVDVAAEDAKLIKADITRITEERQKAVVTELHARAKEMVVRVQTNLSNEKPIIRDTLMTNLESLVGLVGAFNTHKDPELVQLEDDLRMLIRKPEQLRARPEVRSKTLERANDVITRMKWA